MKNSYARQLGVIVCLILACPLTAFGNDFANREIDCFAEEIDMHLEPLVVGKIAPVFAVCESKKAAIYFVKAMESKNKIQLEKAESVCEKKTEIGEVKEIYHSFSVPIPKEKKTGVIAAVNLVDDLFGKSYFALTLSCGEESAAHRVMRENQDSVAKICLENSDVCEMVIDEDIRKSKKLRELRAKPGDVIVNNKLLKSDDLNSVVERIWGLKPQGKEMDSTGNIDQKSQEPSHAEILASERAIEHALRSMTTKITRAWRRPVAFNGGLEVYLQLSLNSDGDLVDVRVVRTSGDTLFDRSALTAVKRAAPFKVIEKFDRLTFNEKFKLLTVKFRPED